MKFNIVFGVAWSLILSILSILLFSCINSWSINEFLKLIIQGLYVWIVFFVWAYPLWIIQKKSKETTMTDEQIVELVSRSENKMRDLCFAYIANLEIELKALENLLYEKKVFISREELENAFHSLMKNKFQSTILHYDLFSPKYLAAMKAVRSSQPGTQTPPQP